MTTFWSYTSTDNLELKMRGVQLDEPSTPITKQWNQDLQEFVRNLSSPKLDLTNQSQSIDLKQEDEVMRLPSELCTEMKDKCTVSCEKTKEKSTPKNWRKRIMDRKSSAGKISSLDIDEAVELSFDSTSSSSGLKDSKVTFTCDTSPETSDFDLHSDTKSVDSKQSYTKKDKESKRRRFKRMITRPLRRSHSAGCTNDIPAHALFVDSDPSQNGDTMESRAMELSLYHQRFRSDSDGTTDREQTRRVHKTCSADAAMMNSPDFMTNTSQPKSKSRNSGFKNMKRKFQNLRRRNTDTALVPKFSLPLHFTIPTYDQAFQWSKSFESLLTDNSGLELFKGFLKSEFSEENLEFWIACEEFRFCKEFNVPVLAQKIYSDYVAFQAPKEVNLDSTTRMTTVSNLENPSKQTFEVAQHKIQALMEKDSYPRFIESELYQQILESVSKV
ncbi:uncharacterized protein LOC134707377 isoform X2 [Mytilus trossulus]|uniref:uncharacterized protein LOC134707377 isoform X2 n=1 Tax=Mytilus trossulus TaxID=6551 RepID=UPI0030075324